MHGDGGLGSICMVTVGWGVRAWSEALMLGVGGGVSGGLGRPRGGFSAAVLAGSQRGTHAAQQQQKEAAAVRCSAAVLAGSPQGHKCTADAEDAPLMRQRS